MRGLDYLVAKTREKWETTTTTQGDSLNIGETPAAAERQRENVTLVNSQKKRSTLTGAKFKEKRRPSGAALLLLLVYYCWALNDVITIYLM